MKEALLSYFNFGKMAKNTVHRGNNFSAKKKFYYRKTTYM